MILTNQQISPTDVKVRQENNFNAGDTVRVHQKIAEKDKTRIQVFEGTVIARKHGTEPGATFTVRRVGTDGITVEKIFPLYTPVIDRIEVTRKTKTRRAKLYFLRGRTPRQLREKLRRKQNTVKEVVTEQSEQREKTPQQREVSVSQTEQKLQKESHQQERPGQPEEKPQQNKKVN